MGIGTVSFVLDLLSFVAEFLCLHCSAFFSAGPLIGVAVMGRVAVGQVMDLDCPVWILGGFKTMLGLVAEMCIPPCFGVCNRLGSGGHCELTSLLGLVTPSRLRCPGIQADGLLRTNFLPWWVPINWSPLSRPDLSGCT